MVQVLQRIRSRGRYSGKNGVNVLTNAVPESDFDRVSLLHELEQAQDSVEDLSQIEDRKHGLSYGLNPYTDWSLTQIEARPSHWYLFLGVDWYSIAAIFDFSRKLQKDGLSWSDYLIDPFIDKDDRYWRNLWSWILNKLVPRKDGEKVWNTSISKEEAANFIMADGGGFLFHNLIPYLRSASASSVDSPWPREEWRRISIKEDCIDDLRLIRKQTVGSNQERIAAFCTGERSKKALEKAGYSDRIYNFHAHPSHGIPHRTESFYDLRRKFFP